MRALLIDPNCSITYGVELANALSESGDVTLMLPHRASARLTDSVASRVKLRQFQMPRLRQPANVILMGQILKAIASERPDVVHQVNWHLWMNLVLPAVPGLSLVATAHDVEQHPGDRESMMSFQKWQWRRAARVIVHADAIKKLMVARHGIREDKIRVIPMGAFTLYRDWAEDAGREHGNTVLFFGRIWGYKGLRYLIEAEPLISARVPDVRIVIAGQGEPFGPYEAMMVHRDRFEVHNYDIPEEMVPRLFQEASVVALPYVEASQSGVAAVAFAFGRPVVATDVGGLPEMIDAGETGLLVPPRDAASLADAIVSLLLDRDKRERMQAKALEKARTQLSWASIAHATWQVYRDARPGGRTASGATGESR